MATRPFNTTYKILDKGGFVLINGEQIVKIDVRRQADEWKVQLHLSDGSIYALDGTGAAHFANQFATKDEIEGKAKG